MRERTPLLSLALLLAIAITSPSLSAEADQTRVARDMVKVLEAYAVYKMGQYDLAFERYMALAQAGNRQGMLNVANMYAEGKGVGQDHAQAFNWYLKLAEAGDQMGMEETARAYRTGTGTEKDLDKAAYWDSLAREP